MSTMHSKRRPPEKCAADASEPQAPEAVAGRLAGLLPEEALEDASRASSPTNHGPGGLLSKLAGRVLETAMGAELTDHLGHPPGGMPQGAPGAHHAPP
jgi:hypothetical protein